MNVYDFDNTIYSGESVFDFYLFCVKRYPSLARYVFIILLSWAKYKLLLLSREKLLELAKRYAMKFVDTVGSVEKLVGEFWDTHENKIKKFYLREKRDDDVIVSASVSFLLGDICARLGIKNLVCSEIDTATGEVRRLCFRQSKPDFFKSAFPDGKIENFYSDSMNDLPMMRLAENAYLVRGEKIVPVEKERLK